MLAWGEPPPGRPREGDADRRADWPGDLSEIVYVDHFGNAMTGLRAAVNQERADRALGLAIGIPVEIVSQNEGSPAQREH